MRSKVLSSVLLLLAVAIAVESAQNKTLPAINLKVSSEPETREWLRLTNDYVKTTTDNLVSADILESVSVESVKKALKEGRIDVAISAHPFSQEGSNVDFMHFPIGTGGIVFYANLGEDRTISFTALQMAHIMTGVVRRWSDDDLSRALPWLKQVAVPIKVITWGADSTEMKQVRAFMEKNTEGYFNPLTKFTADAMSVSSMDAAIEEVKKTPGAITWATFHTKIDHYIPIQLFVPQSEDYVSPTVSAFKNSLMPFKKPSDVPRQEDTDTWFKSFTLTDMTRMPPDGSCMSMPPYALSRFYYAIIRRDQTSSQEYRGSALAAYLRLLFSPQSQTWIVSTNLFAEAPPAALISNTEALKRIALAPGETVDAYLASAPIEETKEQNMENGPGMNPGMAPGSGMTPMQPASTGAVAAMMIILLSSGIVCTGVYLCLQKFYFKSDTTILDHASWVPFAFKSSKRGQPKAYEPLKSTHEVKM